MPGHNGHPVDIDMFPIISKLRQCNTLQQFRRTTRFPRRTLHGNEIIHVTPYTDFNCVPDRCMCTELHTMQDPIRSFCRECVGCNMDELKGGDNQALEYLNCSLYDCLLITALIIRAPSRV